MRIMLLLLIATILFSATIPSTFSTAKEISTRLYNTHHLESFYTETQLAPAKSNLTLKLRMVKSPYQGKKYVSRGQKIEWEHIVPASWFRTASPYIAEAWNNGNPKCVTSSGNTYKGRKCAEKVSFLFNKMEADMYNLVPVIGALNALRSDKPFGIIDGEMREFGETLDVEINRNMIEVMPSKRGDVARIMLYMNKKYRITFPDHSNTIEMLKQWDAQDPEDAWEKQKKQILKDTYGMEF